MTGPRVGAVGIPDKMLAFADRGPQWAAFLQRLPALAASLIDEWDLVIDGPGRHGECALVVPVVAEGSPAVLKLGWPHWEAEHEHVALQAWCGCGAVRLLRADPERWAMVLERASTVDLNAVPVIEACQIIAALYADLHIAPPPGVRRVADLCRDWADRLVILEQAPHVPRGMVNQARHLARLFGSEPAVADRLLHTDLHLENVLAADREPWLAIDPKPLAGDPCYEIAPLLWNRMDEAFATGDFSSAVRARFDAVVATAGFDAERVRDWITVRMMVNAMEELEEPSPPSDEKDGWVRVAAEIVQALDE